MKHILTLALAAICICQTAETKKKELTWKPRVDVPLITPSSRPFTPKAGLQDRHIAVWQSHGWYYEQNLDRWEWQRGRMLQTVEDLYTQSYVLPFLVPMLENAGANVLLPRERDTNTVELVLDNNGMLSHDGTYTETEGEYKWMDGSEPGFAHRKAYYENDDRPFQDGTFRQVPTIKKGQESSIRWTPDIPQRGEYAVYVSYHTVEKSTTDALYTVHHMGGDTQFRVNQKMGGGTWIYLGTFLFDKGQNDACCVTLSNVSHKKGQVVTADGVKIGGGMGNIVRNGLRSNHPRFTEGSRYWLQWAGAPDSIFTPFHHENDYNDDYCSRALWVNWLGGGSDVLPQRDGLHVPLDLSLAFHTDAGTRLGDSTIGTLMIYESETEGRTTYSNGASRELAGHLCQMVQDQIVGDVRALYEPEWTKRDIWNRPYFEARVPEIPAILLELLSHQNFADMRYGLDPRFRFTASRAIYKAMLRFVAEQRGTKAVVQPLPVNSFATSMNGNGEVTLQWKATIDTLEATADPTSYIVYTRKDNGGWDNGSVTGDCHWHTTLEPGHIYSWKVCALNDGGCSFPSEILSAGIPQNAEGCANPVIVINNFTRVCAPADFDIVTTDSIRMAGFLDDVDHGVPYLRDISYIGSQKEFHRNMPWTDDDNNGFGDSYANYETEVIAGNTFDYPYLHGQSLMAMGKAFVSCSASDIALSNIMNNVKQGTIIDLILGKQYQSKMGNGKHYPIDFKTFTAHLQAFLTEALQKKGARLFASGAYVGTDLWQNPLVQPADEDKTFATEVLKYKWRANLADKGGRMMSVRSPYSAMGEDYEYANTLNSDTYVVEAPDAIEPACDGAHTVLRYTENNLSAAVAYRGADYSTYIMGVPFESLLGQEERNALMKEIVLFLLGN